MITSSASSLALALFALLPLASAQDDPIPIGPFGTSPEDIVVSQDDPSQIFVTLIGTLFESTDSGRTIHLPPISGAYPTLKAIDHVVGDPKDSKRLLIIAEDEIWESRDFGTTWTLLFTGNTWFTEITVSASSNMILASTYSTVYRSTDDGLTFSPAASGFQILTVAISPVNDQHWAFGGKAGMQTTIDGGTAFRVASSGLSWVESISYHPTDQNMLLATSTSAVFRSQNGGISFLPIKSPVPQGFQPRFVSFAPNGIDAWLGAPLDLWKSTDSGEHFAPVPGVTDHNLWSEDIAFDASGIAYFVAWGQEGGVWRDSGPGLPLEHLGLQSGSTSVITTAGGLRIAAGGTGVVAGSTILEPVAWPQQLSKKIQALIVDPADPTRWISAGEGVLADTSIIVETTGSGSSSVKVYGSPGSGEIKALLADPLDATHMLAGVFAALPGRRGILESFDSGTTWAPIPGTEGWQTVTLVADIYVPGRIVQLSADGTWAESLDSGLTWTQAAVAFPTTGQAARLIFDPNRAGTLYLTSYPSSLLRSDDGGQTWSTLAFLTSPFSDIETLPGIPGLLWSSPAVFSPQQTVEISTDFGTTWSVEALIETYSFGAGLHFDAATDTLFAGFTDYGVWELPHAAPYFDLGGATAGTGSELPRHFPTGGLPTLGSLTWGLEGDRAVGGGVAVLAVSAAHLDVPLFGGTVHPGAPYAAFQAVPLAGPSGAAGQGHFSVTFGLPTSPTLVGLELFSQFVVVGDTAAADPSGLVLSNGLRTRLRP